MASITLENLNKTYPNGFVSVKNLSLHIEDGEFVTFFGPSGCGKSWKNRRQNMLLIRSQRILMVHWHLRADAV